MNASPTTNMRLKSRGSLLYLLIIFLIPLSDTVQANPMAGDPVITDLQSFCASQKGFNLLGKFDVNWSNEGYRESEFSMIHELGFNFVRLPVDYRTYTRAGDWDVFLENEVQEIDNAIQWGSQYDVHVSLNLHRAPGYCVNASALPPNQDLDLWTDSVAQQAFVRHWEYFARRYSDIPNSRLSFNLVNEPSGVSEEAYLNVMRMAIEAIHAISPERIIFVDGLDYGRNLIPALRDEPYVAQAVHCYDPFTITHYKADWVNGSDSWPVPQWPVLMVSNYLYGPQKSEFHSPLIIEGDFAAGTEITVNVHQVSITSTLQIRGDQQVVYSKEFVCGPDTGDDFSEIIESQWGYQNISNKDFTCTLDEPASSLSFENTAGDWMTINSITIREGENETSLALSDNTWGKSQDTYLFRDGTLKTIDGEDLLPFETYQANIDVARENNIAFMVQEFGVYNQTPYDVTIGFLSDLMGFFNKNGIGWALWNFDGPFGILNSGRSDCPYESFQGNQLDSGMLAILAPEEISGTQPSATTGGLHIYPSPASGMIHVATTENTGRSHFEILDMTGRVVKSFYHDSHQQPSFDIDVSRLTAGAYILSVRNRGGRNWGRFLIE